VSSAERWTLLAPTGMLALSNSFNKKLGQAAWGRMRRAQPLLLILIFSGLLKVTPKVALADDLITLGAAS
jgi:hypothetical protein